MLCAIFLTFSDVCLFFYYENAMCYISDLFDVCMLVKKSSVYN